MIGFRRFFPISLGLSLAVCLLLAGCSLGYTNLRPGENSSLYAPMFSDFINLYDDPRWLWIRGSISGDFSGEGGTKHEAVIATIQEGDSKTPGPIEAAFLLICEIGADGNRTAVARTVLFDGDPLATAPRPENNLSQISSVPLTKARMQKVQDKITLKESVVVYFWGDFLPGGVWYAGYSMQDGKLIKNLETILWQTTPGFITANLDKSIATRHLGYQLLFPVTAIPVWISEKLGPVRDAPLWGHIFTRDREGIYRQADVLYGEHYRELENSWNQTYLKAILKDFPPEELAWYEYHMGIINYYTNNRDMAVGFLNKAAKGAKEPTLIEAIRIAIDAIIPDETSN